MRRRRWCWRWGGKSGRVGNKINEIEPSSSPSLSLSYTYSLAYHAGGSCPDLAW